MNKMPPLPSSEYGLTFYDEGGAHELPGRSYTADMRAAADALRAALDDSIPNPVGSPTTPFADVPAGWRLVPMEPTIGMCIAGDSARVNVDDMTRTPAIYRAMLSAAPAAPSTASEPAESAEPVAWMWQHPETGNVGFVENAPHSDLEHWERINRPRTIVAPLYAAPPAKRKPLTPREIELIDGMIDVQLHHARQCDGISNRTMAEKQKGWDMERVALLQKLRAQGITGD